MTVVQVGGPAAPDGRALARSAVARADAEDPDEIGPGVLGDGQGVAVVG